MDACVEHSVSKIVIISVTSVSHPESIFGEQLLAIENYIQLKGLCFCILRVPFILDNYLRQLHNMTTSNKLFGPIHSQAKHNSIAANDVGEICAIVLANPQKEEFNNKIFTLTGVITCEAEVAAAFSKFLKIEVAYEQVSYSIHKESLISFGYPSWQVDGMLELYELIDVNDPCMCESCRDGSDILRREMISLDAFIECVCGQKEAVKSAPIINVSEKLHYLI